MKTNLIDMVKVTPVSKGLERQQFTPTRGVSSTESSGNRQQSTNTFNQALENHQNSHKDTPFEKSGELVKKSELSTKEKDFVPAQEVKPQQMAKTQEEGQEVSVELSEEETVELDTITLSTAVQAMQQEIDNGPIQESTGHGENEVESKIDTLLSLLSKQTDLKIPKLEQYVSTMRDAGKSVQEILNTLKSALEEVSEDKDIDLKDFMLKIVYPKEKGHQQENTEPLTQEVSDEKEMAVNEKDTKKQLNNHPEIATDKQLKGVDDTQPVAEEKAQKIPSVKVEQQKVSGETSLGDVENKDAQKDPRTTPIQVSTEPETEQSIVQQEGLTPEKPSSADDNLVVAETLQLLRDKVNTLLDQLNDGIFENAPQKLGNVKGLVENTLDQSGLTTEVPEKLLEALSERLNVSKEDIKDFLHSNLIPSDKLQPFIQSFNTVDTQEFIQTNEALLSQMKAFIKLHHHTDSGSKITLHARSITVETTVVKQLILEGFNKKGFYSEFLNRKEPTLFKSSQGTYTVEKLSVRFVSKSVSGETTGKSFFKNTESDFLEKAAQTTKRVFQQTFKNGYETTSQRMSDLERFHAKAKTTETQSEHLSNKSGKTMPLSERVPVSEKTSEVKFQTVSMSDDKELKGKKPTNDHETNTHQNEFKSAKNVTNALFKYEQTNQVRNLEQVYQKIKDMTQLMARQQTRTELATIKLNPPELGRVSLEVIKEGNKISILMQVETKEAQEILNKNSNLLAGRLVNSGFELQKVTVQLEKYEEQGNNQSNQNDENNSQQQQNENQEGNNENEYPYEEEYTFADLLKGGIEENAS